MKPDFSKKAKIGALISAVWLIIFFVVSINESRGNIDEEFLSIFLIIGVLPILIGWGIRWIKHGNSDKKE
jgi:hypothetical protein